MAEANPISVPNGYEPPHPATVEVNAERLPIVFMKDGGVFASSRDVASFFCKQHKDVLRDIRNLIEKEPSLGQRNFAPFKINDLTGESTSHYEMDRDGFTLLAMGFTGARALKWKLSYIAAFNAMEAQLRAQSQAATIDLNDPAQLVPLLTAYAQRAQISEAQVVEMTPKAEAFDRLDTATGNLTLRPSAKVLGCPEHKFKAWMQVNRWAFRQSGKGPLQAYREKIEAGYLDHKLGRYVDEHTGEDKTSITLVITPKGMARLAQLLPRGM